MPTITLPLDDHASRLYSDAVGALTVTPNPGPARGFLPRAVKSVDGSAAMSTGGGSASIRLRTRRGVLRLTPTDYVLDAGSRPYSGAAYEELARLIRTDDVLRDSARALRRALDQTMYGYAATVGAAPDRRVADVVLAGAERRTTFATKRSGGDCRLVTLEKSLRRTITSWGAAASDPDDLAVRTWAAADALADEVLRDAAHCARDSARFLGSWGDFAIPTAFVRPAPAGRRPVQTGVSKAAATEALGPFAKVLRCLLVDAKWSISTLDDFGVSIPGVSNIPLGVTVKLNRSCTDTLKSAVTADDLVRIIPDMVELFADEGIDGVIKALGLSLAVVPVVAGVTVGQIVLVAILVLAAHALIVAGQLVVLDAFGLARDGVKLTYPAMPGVVSGVINPVVGLVVLANTPVIVIPR